MADIDNLFASGNTFVSPGYAVASTLQDVLAQRRAQQRQEMLDALTKERVEGDLANQRENTASLKEQREAAAAENKQKALNTWLGSISPHSYVDPSDIAAHPGSEMYFKKSQKNVPESTSQITDFHLPPNADWQGPINPSPSNQELDDFAANAPKPPPVTPEYGMEFQGLPQDQRREAALRELQSMKLDSYDNLSPLQKVMVLEKMRDAFPSGSLEGFSQVLQGPKQAADKHSAEYVEYMDYVADETKAGHKPMSFNEYMNADANRKARAAGVGAGGGVNDQLVTVPDPNDPTKTMTIWANPRSHVTAPFTVGSAPPKLAMPPGAPPVGAPPVAPPPTGGQPPVAAPPVAPQQASGGIPPITFSPSSVSRLGADKNLNNQNLLDDKIMSGLTKIAGNSTGTANAARQEIYSRAIAHSPATEKVKAVTSMVLGKLGYISQDPSNANPESGPLGGFDSVRIATLYGAQNGLAPGEVNQLATILRTIRKK